jgi:hypothetical protein
MSEEGKRRLFLASRDVIRNRADLHVDLAEALRSVFHQLVRLPTSLRATVPCVRIAFPGLSDNSPWRQHGGMSSPWHLGPYAQATVRAEMCLEVLFAASLGTPALGLGRPRVAGGQAPRLGPSRGSMPLRRASGDLGKMGCCDKAMARNLPCQGPRPHDPTMPKRPPGSPGRSRCRQEAAAGPWRFLRMGSVSGDPSASRAAEGHTDRSHSILLQ